MPEAATSTTTFKAPTHAATAPHLRFADIGRDMLVLKDGSARAVLEVTPICLAGYSDEEQRGLMERYARFLNGLEQPLQILLKSRTLDIEHYLEDLKVREEAETRARFKPLLRDYRGLIEKFLPYSGFGIMRRSAYLVVAVEPPKDAAAESEGGFFSLFTPNKLLREAKTKQRREEALATALDAEVAKVLASFQEVGLPVRRLPTLDLIRLFVDQYHPGTHDHDHDALFDQFDSLPPA